MYRIDIVMSPSILISSLRPSKAELAETKHQLYRAVDATVDDAIKKLRADQKPKKKRTSR